MNLAVRTSFTFGDDTRWTQIITSAALSVVLAAVDINAAIDDDK